MQRVAATSDKPFLGPIQPDLTGEKVTRKKGGYGAQYTNHQGENNHLNHIEDTKENFAKDGSPLPKQQHYFRKSTDHYLHDNVPIGHYVDPNDYHDNCFTGENK